MANIWVEDPCPLLALFEQTNMDLTGGPLADWNAECVHGLRARPVFGDHFDRLTNAGVLILE